MNRTLAVDVGNSRYKIGLFGDAGPTGLPAHVESLVVPLAEELPWDVIRGWIAGAAPRGVVAGANPAGLRRVRETWPRDAWPAPLVVDDPAALPVVIDVPFPGGVGVDRLLNVVTANVLRDADQPAIVVDSGTATTVDYVSPAGAFMGGAILPGFELAARSLHHYTALLPLIPVEELVERDHEPVGRDTRSALRSGLYHGQLGAVRELIARLRAREGSAPHVLVTGGGAPLLAELVAEEHAAHEPHLTLQGLVLVADHLEPDQARQS